MSCRKEGDRNVMARRNIGYCSCTAALTSTVGAGLLLAVGSHTEGRLVVVAGQDGGGKIAHYSR